MPEVEAQPKGLRERQAELTRELILKTVVDLLEAGTEGELTVPQVAAASGVSLRTVYRYFPTREELLTAAGEWIAENVFERLRFAESLDEIPELFARGAEVWDEHPELVRAMALSQAGSAVRSTRRRRRLTVIRELLADVTRNLPAAERRRAEAVIAYLDNMFAWLGMRDEAGLEGKEIGKAVGWAMETLIADLRRRNDEAGEAKANAMKRRK